MSQEVTKKRRKRRKSKKRLRMLRKILLTSMFSIVLLTVTALLALFMINRNADQTADSGEKTGRKHAAPDRYSQTGERKAPAPAQEHSPDHKQAVSQDRGSPDDRAGAGDYLQADIRSEHKIRDCISGMTLEEKIAQLFVITPDALTKVTGVVMAGEKTKEALNGYPVGGLVYLKNNIRSEEQFATMVSKAQSYSVERIGLPLFICVDEEGGTVARISGRGFANVPDIPDMCRIGTDGDGSRAYQTGLQIGEYLSRFQVNVDFAPVADVFSNPANTVIRRRAFGSDPQQVADMVVQEVRGLKEKHMQATLKHFPGHGDTEEDSHSGWAYSYKTLDELRSCELIPFQAGIDAGAEFVMTGHISLPKVLGDHTPASMSHKMITEVLRDEMGFDGIVITDALNMGAISQNYSPQEAATGALKAGADLLLMPQDFERAYAGILDAVKKGEIRQSRIDESLERILKVKFAMQDAS